MRSSECRLHSKWCLNLFLGAMTMLFFMVLALNMTYMRNQQQTSMATARSWLEAGTYSRAYDISDLTGLCESYKPLKPRFMMKQSTENVIHEFSSAVYIT